MNSELNVIVKRVYEKAEPGDGFRILVDRLWPRGISREAAKIELWLKDLAPTTELRKWYGHDAEKWPEFRRRYFAELDANPAALEPLLVQVRRGRVCLLFSSKEEKLNNAWALVEYLREDEDRE